NRPRRRGASAATTCRRRRSPSLFGDEIADRSPGLDATGRPGSCHPRRWPDDAGLDQLGQPIGTVVESGEASDGLAAIGDDHLLALADAVEVAAEVVLEVTHADLDPRCSYVHEIIVATSPWSL